MEKDKIKSLGYVNPFEHLKTMEGHLKATSSKKLEDEIREDYEIDFRKICPNSNMTGPLKTKQIEEAVQKAILEVQEQRAKEQEEYFKKYSELMDKTEKMLISKSRRAGMSPSLGANWIADPASFVTFGTTTEGFDKAMKNLAEMTSKPSERKLGDKNLLKKYIAKRREIGRAHV